MSESDLTEDAIRRVFAPMMLLSGAPEMRDLWGPLLGLLVDEGVTCLELGQAVVDVLKREKFWPAPTVLIERVHENRKAALLARREEERKRKLSNLAQIGTAKRETGDTYAERQRQAMKKQLGLGEYRSAEHRRRYRDEIPVSESYVPPSLRALTQEPDDSQRGNGPRSLL